MPSTLKHVKASINDPFQGLVQIDIDDARAGLLIAAAGPGLPAVLVPAAGAVATAPACAVLDLPWRPR